MRIFTIFTLLIFTCIITYGQNLVGFHGRDILKYMKENKKDFNSEKVANSRFKYLKYSDSSDRQTLLFFISSDSICRSVRLICDLSIKEEKVKEFNSIYKTSGENRWIDNRDGKDYLVVIRDEKWSCIITIEPDK